MKSQKTDPILWSVYFLIGAFALTVFVDMWVTVRDVAPIMHDIEGVRCVVVSRNSAVSVSCDWGAR